MKLSRIAMNVIICWLIGVAICLIIKTIAIKNEVATNTVFVAELESDIMPNQKITAERVLSDLDQINKGSIEMVSRSTAMEEMAEEMPEIKYMSENPFRDIILFKTKGTSESELSDLIANVVAIPGINKVVYDEEMITSFDEASSRRRIGVLTMSILVLLLTCIALALRIRRDILANRIDLDVLTFAGSYEEEIIGIRRSKAIKWGFISSLVATIFILLNILFINQTLFEDIEITFLQALSAVFTMIILVVGIHAFMSHNVIKNYLSQLNTAIQS